MHAMTYVQRRGVGLYVDGDRLRAYPTTRIDIALRSFIRGHREEIIRALQEPDITTTVGNILALSAEEVDELRGEIADAPDDSTWIEHDREALRLAEDQLARRRAAAGNTEQEVA